MFYTGILIIYRDYFAMRPSNTNTKGMVSRWATLLQQTVTLHLCLWIPPYMTFDTFTVPISWVISPQPILLFSQNADQCNSTI
jgi:hypothetical protein